MKKSSGIIWGVIFNAIKGKNADNIIDGMRDAGEKLPEGYATFSGCNMNFDGQMFRCLYCGY